MNRLTALTFLLFSCLTLGIAACGTPEPEIGPPGQTGAMGERGSPGPQGQPGKNGFELPLGVVITELYSATYIARNDGLLLSTHRSDSGAYDPGQYHTKAGVCDPNNRTGSKVIVGFNGFHNVPLADIQSLEIDAVTRTTTLDNFYINLLVADRSGKVGILVISSATVPELKLGPKSPIIKIDFSKPIFTAVDGAFGLPPHTSSTGALLPAGLTLQETFPDDCGMPANRIMEPLLLVLGDSNTNKDSQALVRMLNVRLTLLLGSRPYIFGN